MSAAIRRSFFVAVDALGRVPMLLGFTRNQSAQQMRALILRAIRSGGLCWRLCDAVGLNPDAATDGGGPGGFSVGS